MKDTTPDSYGIPKSDFLLSALTPFLFFCFFLTLTAYMGMSVASGNTAGAGEHAPWHVVAGFAAVASLLLTLGQAFCCGEYKEKMLTKRQGLLERMLPKIAEGRMTDMESRFTPYTVIMCIHVMLAVKYAINAYRQGVLFMAKPSDAFTVTYGPWTWTFFLIGAVYFFTLIVRMDRLVRYAKACHQHDLAEAHQRTLFEARCAAERRSTLRRYS